MVESPTVFQPTTVTLSDTIAQAPTVPGIMDAQGPAQEAVRSPAIEDATGQSSVAGLAGPVTSDLERRVEHLDASLTSMKRKAASAFSNLEDRLEAALDRQDELWRKVKILASVVAALQRSAEHAAGARM